MLADELAQAILGHIARLGDAWQLGMGGPGEIWVETAGRGGYKAGLSRAEMLPLNAARRDASRSPPA